MLEEPARHIAVQRRRAIQLLVAGASYDQIESETDISGRMALRLVKRALETDPDGKIYGFRVIAPYSRIVPYRRVADVDRDFLSPPAGASGAFGQLLRSYPELKLLIDDHVLKLDPKVIHESRIRLKDLHARFIRKCRELNIDAGNQYPFNTKTRAHRSLSTYVRQLILGNPAKSIPAVYGTDAGKTLQSGDGTNRPILLPYVRVEADAHHIDAIFSIRIPSIFGDEISRTVNRPWAVVIKEPISGAILGYSRSFRAEVSSEEVLEAVRNALRRWEPRELRIPTLLYGKGAGFPSSRDPRFVGAGWKEFSVDGALANVCDRVKSKLDAVMHGEVKVLTRHIPNDRPFVERFFGLLEENGFHRLPNTTGSGPKDPRRKKPEQAAVKYNMQIEEFDELLEVMIANHNSTPGTALGGRTPLEFLEYLCAHHDCWPKQADQVEVERLLAVRRVVTVRGDITKGRRPHINYQGAKYSSDVLRNAFNFIGKKITIEVVRDIRTVRAYSDSGADLGPLLAAPPWHRTPHTLEMRQAAQAQIHKRTLHHVEGSDPIIDYMDFLEVQFRKGKPVTPLYVEMRKLLTDHWQESHANGTLELTSGAAQGNAAPVEIKPALPKRSPTADKSDVRPRVPRMAING